MILFFSSRRRHTRLQGDWSSDVCSSDLASYHVGQIVYVAKALHGADWQSLSIPPGQSARYNKRSEERRVGKGVDLGGRRIIKKKKKQCNVCNQSASI